MVFMEGKKYHNQRGKHGRQKGVSTWLSHFGHLCSEVCFHACTSEKETQTIILSLHKPLCHEAGAALPECREGTGEGRRGFTS